METSRAASTSSANAPIPAERQNLQRAGLQTVKRLRSIGVAKYAGGTALLSGGVAAVGGAGLLAASAAGLKLGALGMVFKVLGLVTFAGLALNPFSAGIVCGLLVLAGLYLAYKGYKSRQEGKALATGDLQPLLKAQIGKEGKVLLEKRSELSQVEAEFSAAKEGTEHLIRGKTGEKARWTAFLNLNSVRDRRDGSFTSDMQKDLDTLQDFFHLEGRKRVLEGEIEVLEEEIPELEAISANQDAIDETKKGNLALVGGASVVAGLGLSVAAGVANLFALTAIGVAAANAGKSALLNVGQFFAWMV